MRTRIRIAVTTAVAVVVASGPLDGQEPSGAQVAELLVEMPLKEDSLVFLQSPVGAARFDDGTVVVADGMAQAVWIFDGQGAFLRSAGRPGEGPDEFSTPGWMGRCGPETATVWDFSLMRFTEIHPERGIVSQRRLQDVANLPRPPARLACGRDGRMLALLRLIGDRIEGREVSVLTAPLYLVEPLGDTRVIDPRAPVIEWSNEHRTYRPVSPTTHFAVRDSVLFIAHSDSATVHVHDLAAGTTRTWTIEGERRKPTDAHVRRDAEALTQFVSDRAGRNEIVERYLTMDRPDFLPRFSALRVDPAGRLWLVVSIPGDEQTLLHRYDRDGRLREAVVIPGALEVYEIGQDYVVGSRVDPISLEPKVLVYGFAAR